MTNLLTFEVEPFQLSTHEQSGETCQCPMCRAAHRTSVEEETAPAAATVPAPGRFYAIQYKKGGLLTTTSRAYGVGEGTARLRLAQQINRHSLNRKFWVQPGNDFERRYFPDGIISFNPRFTCGAVQRAATAKEGKCFARIWIPPITVPKPVPPDRGSCSVPPDGAHTEIDLEFARDEIEQSPTVAVQPRVSLFQNATESSHRNHFECGASRWAAKSGSFKNPDTVNCAKRVGPTSYDSGADIIRTIESAHACLRRPIEAVHVFSHSGSGGVFGSDPFGSIGLYHGTLEADSRSNGGRLVADLPTTPLSRDVVFVLHGCNTAAGDTNFARALYEHLAGTLRNPRVFGHHNSGCASRDNSWREYSNRSPDGHRRLSSLSPHYEQGRCCGEP
jgi:hypothetical protein